MSDWNGLPDQPEQSGWHWLAGRYCPERWRIAIWNAQCSAWLDENMSPDMYVAHKCIYGGPALNPSEIAQMRKDERERCATAAGDMAFDIKYSRDQAEVCMDVEEAIRALTDDEGKKS